MTHVTKSWTMIFYRNLVSFDKIPNFFQYLGKKIRFWWIFKIQNQLKLWVKGLHVQTDPVSTVSLQYSDSISSFTRNQIPSKSLSYNTMISLYSLWKSLPFAALRRRFSNLMYVLKSSWSNRSSTALMIQSKDL